jgi:hypothetical protein
LYSILYSQYEGNSPGVTDANNGGGRGGSYTADYGASEELIPLPAYTCGSGGIL